MTPDDPRHGTYAGWQAHKGERDKPCEPCRVAEFRYRKRMKLRLARDGSNLVELGADAHRVLETYPIRVISRETGIGDPKLYGYRIGGPSTRVHRTTRDAIIAVGGTGLWTAIGVVRRVRALSALGWSAARIAAEANMNPTSVRELLTNDQAFVRIPTGDAILATYARLSMTPPPEGGNQQTRSGVSRARARARAAGWAPPLAWDNIDDPDETPTGFEGAPRPGRHTTRPHRDHGPVDEVAVDRILGGDYVAAKGAVLAVRLAVIDEWVARGGAINALDRLTGWNARRDLRATSTHPSTDTSTDPNTDEEEAA